MTPPKPDDSTADPNEHPARLPAVNAYDSDLARLDAVATIDVLVAWQAVVVAEANRAPSSRKRCPQPFAMDSSCSTPVGAKRSRSDPAAESP